MHGTVSDRHTNYSACINTPCTIISTQQLFGASLPSLKILLPCLIALLTRHHTCRRRLSVLYRLLGLLLRCTLDRPYDVRVWQAQGVCYEEMGRCVLPINKLRLI